MDVDGCPYDNGYPWISLDVDSMSMDIYGIRRGGTKTYRSGVGDAQVVCLQCAINFGRLILASVSCAGTKDPWIKRKEPPFAAGGEDGDQSKNP